MSRSLRVQAMLALLNATTAHHKMSSDAEAIAEANKEMLSDAIGTGVGVCILDMDFGAAEQRIAMMHLHRDEVFLIDIDQIRPRGERISSHAAEIGEKMHREAMEMIHSIANEHSVRRSGKTAMMAQVLISCMDHTDIPMFELNDVPWLRGVQLDRPNPDTWSNDQKSRKLPKPSFKQQKNVFRTTMRSVNRNR